MVLSAMLAVWGMGGLLAGGLEVPRVPSRVRLEQRGLGWVLTKNGSPYFVKGAGAPAERLPELARMGANSVRTWGMDEKTGAFLDEAYRNGISVTLGFWMRKHDGFSYRSESDKSAQEAELRKWVRAYKDHPALLVWAVGNEQELGTEWPEVFVQTERLVRAVKEEDPGRPVMTVVADMWPEKMDALLEHCPSVDLLGVNSYFGLPTLEQRMARWTKPYMITEFAFSLPDRDPSREWAGHIEPSSEEKALSAARNYQTAILGLPGRVLGSYYFYWRESQVGTSSLHTTHLSTGERLEVVEVMSRLWGGMALGNGAPRLRGVEPSAPFRVKAGAEFTVSATAWDPDGDGVEVRWEVKGNDPTKRYVGDFEKDLGVESEGVLVGWGAGSGSAVLRAPREAGLWRVLLVARDGRGAGATHTVSFLVE